MPHYPITLNLPDTDQNLTTQAEQAIREEYRNSVQWKRLLCRSVKPLSNNADETIFIVELGHSIEFDWSWEGAIAFRPPNFHKFQENIDTTDDFCGLLTGNAVGNTPSAVWAGEVVQVDETAGRLFVSITDTEHPPHTGLFFVRPFQFLECLHNLYCQPAFATIKELLASRLSASRGDIHPSISGNANAGLDKLRDLWGHSWSVLWGPPGTGKTFTLGEQVAACLNDPTERILVVSTTNKATDEAALSIGRSARVVSTKALEEGKALRIGKSAGYNRFLEEGLEEMLRGTETEILLEIVRLSQQLHWTTDIAQRAQYQQRLQALRRQMKDNAFKIFLSPHVKVVISTAFKAVSLLNDPNLRSSITGGNAPFTTVVIDEAGLISRAATAALSLLAARRVLVVGDAKQLAPISKISRVLPRTQATWVARSSLSHLERIEQTNIAVHLLREQYRMHPQISRAVSAFQYDGSLQDASAVIVRNFGSPAILQNQPRAIWYVLDEDDELGLPSIRAERGPGNRSWIRKATLRVLEKLFSDAEVLQKQGLFLSPFKAQAKDVSHFLKDCRSWSAATIHSQQGAEADLVIFDTVNAGSTGWSYEEWKRLINVGLSRAKEFVLLLASRAEMSQPYLNPLLQNLAPRILTRTRGNYAFTEISQQPITPAQVEKLNNPDLLGSQLTLRITLRPVMSAQQQRLIGLKMDGKPRLVRGVAGSGKTVVLAHWLVQILKGLSDETQSPIWAVYANRSLEGLIRETIEEAWEKTGNDGQLPWHRVSLLHIKDILEPRLKKVGLNWSKIKNDELKYDWNKLSEFYMQREPITQIETCCHAIFIDEAQDLGPNSLKLLTALVERSDPDDPNSRAVNIFYDNAQNIFGQPTPTWAEIGLGMRGRSTVMEESFRSTKPITELALNILYCLQSPDEDADHTELIERGLIEKTTRNNSDWWDVRFNQVDGPAPDFKKFPTETQEIDAICNQVFKWIGGEEVKPRDICVISNSRALGTAIAFRLGQKLLAVKANAVFQTNQVFQRGDRTVIVTTPHSFKGYDSEIVIIAGVDKFVAAGTGILANNLYVAMTRARSVLMLYAQNSNDDYASKLLAIVSGCRDNLLERSAIEKDTSRLDDFTDILELIGREHQDWLNKLLVGNSIQQEPIIAEDGEILAEPVFWFEKDQRKVACFRSGNPGTSTRYKLVDAGIRIIKPGEDCEQTD